MFRDNGNIVGNADILTSTRNASVTFGRPYCINSCLFLFKEFTISYSDIITNQNANFLWLSLPGDYRVTDEALLAETT